MPVYFIRQVEGKRVDAAKELGQAIRAGHWQNAVTIYERYCGPVPEHLRPEPDWKPQDYPWWLYNAPDRVRSHADISPEEVFQAMRSKTRAMGEAYARQKARLAGQRVAMP